MFTTVPLDAVDELIATISELRDVVRSFNDRLDDLDRHVGAMLAHDRQATSSGVQRMNAATEETEN